MLPELDANIAMNEEKDVAVGDVVSHVTKLLNSPKIPELTPELAQVDGLAEIHGYIVELRKQIGSYAKGDFTREINLRGVLAGMVKSLQANMNHLIWQMEQVEAGDFTQRVDFMGQFSVAFNKMVRQLDDALSAIKKKEDELIHLAGELEQEVEKRGAALAALQKSEESFKYLAEHDPLTGLLNRRSFFTQAEMELTRGTIMGHPCCLALMDVDHFKNFNDTHGHLNGDIALRHIADIGSSALRSADIMGRFGGEEFIFLFSKADIDKGIHAADRIRKLIQDSPVDLTDRRVPITASFGVVVIPPGLNLDDNTSLMEFAVGLADDALYRAKSLGRNRVCASEPEAEIPLPENVL